MDGNDPGLSVGAKLRGCLVEYAGRTRSGAAAAVYDRGETAHAAIEGGRDAYTHEYGTDVRYRISCLIKPLVATLVMQLHEAGELDIDERIGTFSRNLRGDARHISLSQLLCHRGGLLDHPLFRVADRPASPSVDALLDRLPQLETFCAAGRSFSYSNLGYLLLEAAIEHVCGAPLTQVLEQRILRPLGIGRAGPCRWNSFLPAVGRNIAVSCRDVLSFVLSFVVDDAWSTRPHVLDRAGIARMLGARSQLPACSFVYWSWALGWARFDEDLYGHNATLAHGKRMVARFYPNSGRAIVVVADRQEVLPLLYSMTTKLFGKTSVPQRDASYAAAKEPPHRSTYVLPPPGDLISVQRNGSRLEGRLQSTRRTIASACVFRPVSDGVYLAEPDGAPAVGAYAFVGLDGREFLWDGATLHPQELD